MMRAELGMLLLAGSMVAVGQESGAVPQAPVADAAAASPVRDADGNYRIGHGVSAPRPISMPDPEFSADARRRKVSGNVVVGLTLNADGRPENVHVVRSLADTLGGKADKKEIQAAQSLDEKALEAVRRYQFKPAMLRGTAVPVAMVIEVNFQVF